jgi:hypothetical protein
MADAGLVDAAVMARLANDATLAALCPDGVYWGAAPPRQPPATAFVIVAQLHHAQRPALDSATLYEQTLYLVKAVMLTPSAAPPRQAAQRIDALLHNADLDLAPAGYAAIACRRIERVHTPPEIDPLDISARWQHVGGQYELWSYPSP